MDEEEEEEEDEVESIVLASRVSGCLLDTQIPKSHPSRHPKMLGSYLLKSISSIKLKFFDLNIIPMILCKDLIPNFNE